VSTQGAPEQQLVDALVLLGWFDEARAGHAEGAAAEALAWLRLADLPVHEEGGRRYYDAFASLNALRQRSLEGVDATWRERVLATQRRNAASFAAPGAEDKADERRISLVLERTVTRTDVPAGKRSIDMLPLPVEGPNQRELVIEPIERSEPAELGARLVREPHALVRRGKVPSDGVVRIGARISFTSRWQRFEVEGAALGAADANDPTLRPYLAPEEGLLRVTPTIAAFARSLRKDTPLRTLRTFWNAVFELRAGNLYYDELDEQDPLASLLRGGWFDCLAGATLLAALCRAVGMPARLVHGILLWTTDSGPHYWTEVWLPPLGWVPFDFHAAVLAGGDGPESIWGRCLFARRPHHLVLYRLPLAQPALALRLPAPWYSLPRIESHGAAVWFHARDSGVTLCGDRVELL
jgi:hypothetical protein